MSREIPAGVYKGFTVCGDVKIETFGIHGSMEVETPSYLGQGRYDIGRIGTFTQINMRAEYDDSVYSYIECDSIGRYCSISHGVTIGLPGHAVNFLSTSTLFKFNKQSEKSFLPYLNNRNTAWEADMKKKNFEAWKRPLPIIENDVWIGYGATILNDVTIGNGAIVAANSVVTKSVPPYTIVAGNPAKIIKTRFSKTVIDELLLLQWWDYSPENLMGLPLNNIEKCILELESRIKNQEKWKPSVIIV